MKNYSTYTDKYNEFSRTLLRAIIEKEEKKHVVISPLSIIALLCLTARATAGNTREEILSCISDGSSIDEMISIIREITEKAEATSELKNANAVGVAERINQRSHHGRCLYGYPFIKRYVLQCRSVAEVFLRDEQAAHQVRDGPKQE